MIHTYKATRLWLFTLTFSLFSSLCFSQKVNRSGIEFPEVAENFLLCFLYNDYNGSFDNGLQYIYISTLDDSANIIITCKEYPSFTMQFMLPKHTDTIVSIYDGDFDLIVRKSEEISNKVVRVRSSSPIICVGDNGTTNFREQYAAVSEDKAGSSFRILTYAEGIYDPDVLDYPLVPHLCIAAFYNGTQATITPSEKTMKGSPMGIPLTVELDSGQCFYLQSEYVQGNLRDLTGTEITSNLPVAVFSGHPHAEAPSYNETPDYGTFLIESMPPIHSLGKGHIFQLSVPRSIEDTGLYEYPGREVVRLLAVTNNTQLYFNGIRHDSVLNEGGYFDTLMYATTLIETTKPILIGDYSHFAYLGELDTMPGSNFLAVLPPLESRTTDQLFYTRPDTMFYSLNPEPFYQAQYVQIAVERSNEANVQLDGELIPDSIFADVPGSFGGYEFSIGSIYTSPGRQHRLTVPGKKENGFVFIVYGAAGYGENQGARSGYAYGSQMLYRKDANLAVDEPDDSRTPHSAPTLTGNLYRRSGNPVLRLTSSEPGHATIVLSDLLGRPVTKSETYILSGIQDILLANRALANGIYFADILISGKHIVIPVLLSF
jgi:hypothetical protein